ncbi:hypothetical protein Bbelb_126420 [Branchiostoma belcheri]|nr:hypothetical protein Bbelb_126420 [Branchiostoma belcheri]
MKVETSGFQALKTALDVIKVQPVGGPGVGSKSFRLRCLHVPLRTAFPQRCPEEDHSTVDRVTLLACQVSLSPNISPFPKPVRLPTPLRLSPGTHVRQPAKIQPPFQAFRERSAFQLKFSNRT